jgi:hypothetical protein
VKEYHFEDLGVDGNKIDFEKIGRVGVGLIILVQNRDKCGLF